MKTRTVQLGDLVTIVGGGTPSKARPEYFQGHIPWVSPKDVKTWNIFDSQDHITEDAIDRSSTLLIDPGAVLVVIRSGVLKHTLPVAINRVPVTVNQDLKALICGDRVSAEYLARALVAFSSDLLRTVRGTTADNISTDVLRQLLIPVPPLSEQQRIAGVLEQADRLRRTRRYALELSDSFLPAAFRQLFGSEVECFHRWPVVRLDDCCKRITDGTHLTPKFGSEGVPFIFVKNIENGRIDFTTDKFISKETHQELYRRCPVECGDVLYTIVGATYGQAAPVEDFTEFAFQRHIAHLKPDTRSLLPKFFATIMQLPIVKSQADRWARGAAQPTVNLKELKEFLMPLPPLALQQQFASLVSRHERLRAVQRESLRQAEHLFQSLLHRAFTTGL